MRSLIYVSVIHEEADLGSLAAVANSQGLEICGESEWQNHRKTVALFWNRISDYFEKIEAEGLEIFQDGLPVGGEIAHRIIREGAKRGSINYRIVLDLINRGGIIKKTEDLALLQQELQRTHRLSREDSHGKAERSIFRNRLTGDRLMADRDRFTAETINKTLERRGVLFMGAFHQVKPYLNGDIDVLELKEIKKVRNYFKTLYMPVTRKSMATLSDYMVSHISP